MPIQRDCLYKKFKRKHLKTNTMAFKKEKLIQNIKRSLVLEYSSAYNWGEIFIAIN